MKGDGAKKKGTDRAAQPPEEEACLLFENLVEPRMQKIEQEEGQGERG